MELIFEQISDCGPSAWSHDYTSVKMSPYKASASDVEMTNPSAEETGQRSEAAFSITHAYRAGPASR